jgi:1,4-dihydroxy-2-naphthoate octaprenyltransferase
MTHAVQISPLHAWWIAIRPRTLPAAVAPVLVGTALAWQDGAFAPLPALMAFVAALLLQIAANLANDYYDFLSGADSVGRKGPPRVAQSGLISLPNLRLGMAMVFGAAALVGSYLVSVGGWPILLLGIACLVSAFAYTGGPFPLGYHGMGDLFAFFFFGPVAVCGTYYVQALSLAALGTVQRGPDPLAALGIPYSAGLSPVAIAVALPVGFLTTAILVVNNLRDVETDRRIGKRTLAVILGPTGARTEYVVLLSLAYALLPILVLAGWTSLWSLLPFASVPLAVRLVRSLYIADGTEYAAPLLNQALARTANLDLIFAILLSIGLAI